jgi:anti-anti-sigma factor
MPTTTSGQHFQMTVTCWGARWTVYLSGDLDRATGVQAQHLLASMADHGVILLDIDLHAVTFVDTAGLASIAAIEESLASRGVQVRVVERSPAIHRLDQRRHNLTILAAS